MQLTQAVDFQHLGLDRHVWSSARGQVGFQTPPMHISLFDKKRELITMNP